MPPTTFYGNQKQPLIIFLSEMGLPTITGKFLRFLCLSKVDYRGLTKSTFGHSGSINKENRMVVETPIFFFISIPKIGEMLKF